MPGMIILFKVASLQTVWWRHISGPSGCQDHFSLLIYGLVDNVNYLASFSTAEECEL